MDFLQMLKKIDKVNLHSLLVLMEESANISALTPSKNL